MADALNEAPSTVQRWKNCGRIPATKQLDVLDRAGRLGIRITTDDVVFPLKYRPDFCPVDTELRETANPIDCDRLPASQGSDA